MIESGWVAQGTETRLFEDELCRFIGLPEGHVVAVSSGSAALFLALWALGASGQDVAIPSYACSAIPNAVNLLRGKSVVVDSSVSTPNVDIGRLDSSGCSVAIVAHMFGIPEDLSVVRRVRIIEDCAQSIGATVNHRPVGLQGQLGVFSFSATKLMTSGGQGGAVVARDKEIVEKIRDYREFDFRRDNKSRFNFQLTDLQSAFGRAQLKRLPMLLARREEIIARYRAVAPLIQQNSDTCKSVPYRAVVETKDWEKLVQCFRTRDISCINPMHTWELNGDPTKMKNARRYSQSLVSLPLYPTLTEKSVDKIVNGLIEWGDRVGF